jgi:polysaccharide export outer membrane protein
MNAIPFLLAMTLAQTVQTPARPQAPQTTPPQTPSAGVQVPTLPPQSLDPAATAKYQIGPDDALTITVFDAPDLSGKYRVDVDGFITFNLLGRIAVGGLTLSECQDKLKTLLSKDYIKNPQVRVDVEEFKSQSIYVSGEVRSPNEIRMMGTMTLLRALAQAGSPLSSASSELTIARRKKLPPGTPLPPPGTEQTEVIKVNWRDLQTGGTADVTLQDGDVIFVPKAQTFYIQGFVRNGGSYVLEPGTTVEQAIALAGGLTERGTNRGMKATRTVNGKTIEVDLKLSDKVQPGDVITIKQRLF